MKMTKVEKFFREWSENCRIFINYKPIHSHEDLLRFAEEYHQSQVNNVVLDGVIKCDYKHHDACIERFGVCNNCGAAK